MSSIREIEVLLRAAYPIIFIRSGEEDRVASALIDLVIKRNESLGTKTEFWNWSITEGAVHVATKSTNEDLAMPLSMLDYVSGYGQSGIFLLKDFHHYIKDDAPGGFTLQRKLKDLARSLTDECGGKHIILVGNFTEVPADLENLVAVVDFDLPSDEEIAKVVTNSLSLMPELQAERDRYAENPDLMDKVVDSARGLTLFEVESVLAKSLAATSRLDVQVILNEKKHIIKKSGVLEFHDTSSGLDTVGGLDDLKLWLNQRGKAFTKDAQAYGLPTPKGVLIIGIPGTGKSLISKTIGASWSMPVLRMDVGALFGSFIGQSEANMRKALKTAEAMSPCVLWIDEIEKSMGGNSSGTDGGTTARVFGSFLSWMQEKKEAVFVVATANDVSSLPPEMLRKGRFDELFFVDLPTHEERKEIFKIHISAYKRDPKDFDLLGLAASTEEFSGAEIEQVVVDGLYRSYADKEELSLRSMIESAIATVPLSHTMSGKIEALRKWASSRARSASGKEEKTPVERSWPTKSKKRKVELS